MDEELEKVKKRVEKRLEQYDLEDQSQGPMNDAMDHLERIEGYPSVNLSQFRMSSLPLPIRIIGCILVGSMGVGALITLILAVFH